MSEEQRLKEFKIYLMVHKSFPMSGESSFSDGYDMNGWWHKYKLENKTEEELKLWVEINEIIKENNIDIKNKFKSDYQEVIRLHKK